MAEKVTGHKVNLSFGGERKGDPVILTADADRFTTAAAWAPKYNLEDMVSHAWTWYNK